jgi:hypothetical protein
MAQSLKFNQDEKINSIEVINLTKTFIIITLNKQIFDMKLDLISIPFGVEEYQGKQILNIEVDNEKHNNYLSRLEFIENKIEQADFDPNIINILKNKTFTPTIKTSLKGKTIRTHLMKNTDIYIKLKNGNKMNIDYTNLKNSTANVLIELKGIWVTGTNFGLYWNVKDINVTKL